LSSSRTALTRGDRIRDKADFSDGILEVRVAKPAQPKPRRIEVGGSSDEPKTIEA
jgi:hypothetical protein